MVYLPPFAIPLSFPPITFSIPHLSFCFSLPFSLCFFIPLSPSLPLNYPPSFPPPLPPSFSPSLPPSLLFPSGGSNNYVSPSMVPKKTPTRPSPAYRPFAQNQGRCTSSTLYSLCVYTCMFSKLGTLCPTILCVCLCSSDGFLFPHFYSFASVLYTFPCTRTCTVYTCIYMSYTCIYTHVYVHVHLYTRTVCVCACVHVYIHIWYPCVCVYIYCCVFALFVYIHVPCMHNHLKTCVCGGL